MSAILMLFCAAMAAYDNTVVFSQDFSDPETSPRSPAKLVKEDGRTCLRIDKVDFEKSATVHIPLDAQQIAGQLVTARAILKASGVSEPPNSWNGIKIMLVLQKDGDTVYPQMPMPAGTFEWRNAVETIRVPTGIHSAHLVLGLEKVSGTVWFDSVELRLGRPADKRRRSETPFRGHDLPRLRGAMHGPHFHEPNVRDLGIIWNANHVRWQLNWTPMKKAEEWAKNLEEYDTWLDGALEQFDQALPACEKYGLVVLLDLHTPPGGRAEHGVCRMFSEPKYQDQLVAVWQRIARRYKGNEVIYAYDLLNEPVEGPIPEGMTDWREIATRVARAIREIDPGKPVLFEPGPWGSPTGFDRLIPLDVEHVIYGFHMYLPHAFTHQGVHGSPVGLTYPGEISGEFWDKERLRQAILPAIEFQREFNIHIHVGEFSAIRWAPDHSAYRYLRDVIELFEEYGWDWTYHAFREWDGWSVEHGPEPEDKERAETPTKRQELLLEWFAKNEKPAWFRGKQPGK